ncbi:MAG: recombination protein RecR [Mycoplasma sp.]|nr:recombination protein RecR [Mycoplasma sp.]
MNELNEFNQLIQSLKSFPGISQKQAEKICYFLINQKDEFMDDLSNQIRKLRQSLHYCKECQNISLNEICNICSNDLREQNKLCIVSESEDLQKIEDTNTYSGLYFVLHDEINVKKNNGLNKEVVKKLMEQLKKKKFNEIIFATNWTPNGEATAFFLKNIIKEILPNATFYRLAVGLPINSVLNYADNETLSQAIKNKTKY